MEIKELEILGLTKGEINIYSAILSIGSSAINNIHEKTGMERRAIYDIINKLIEKGLITYTIEKGKRTYQCAPPNKLKEEANKKIEELRRFEKIIPDIEEIYKSKKQKINIEIFRGKEGIKSVFEDMLNYKENYFIGGGYYIMDLLPNYWSQYNKRRIEAGVKWHSLGQYETKEREVPEKKLLWVKYLPKELGKSPSVIFLFGNKVVNVLWSEDFFAFMIESKDIAENYKNYFWYLWQKVAK